MTDLPENVTLDWVGRTLIAMRDSLSEVKRDIQEMRDDMQGMREQLDVAVMTSLRLERSQASIRQDIRELRQRLERLEVAK